MAPYADTVCTTGATGQSCAPSPVRAFIRELQNRLLIISSRRLECYCGPEDGNSRAAGFVVGIFAFLGAVCRTACGNRRKENTILSGAARQRSFPRRYHSVASDPAATPLTAVFAYRSPTAFVGVLGSLLAGNGYVPLNRTFPIERTQIMFERSECSTIVVDQGSLPQLGTLLIRHKSP